MLGFFIDTIFFFLERRKAKLAHWRISAQVTSSLLPHLLLITFQPNLIEACKINFFLALTCHIRLHSIQRIRKKQKIQNFSLLFESISTTHHTLYPLLHYLFINISGKFMFFNHLIWNITASIRKYHIANEQKQLPIPILKFISTEKKKKKSTFMYMYTLCWLEEILCYDDVFIIIVW